MRIVAIAMYICFAVFSVIMSRDSVYLSIYKLALTFYLLAVFTIGGIETVIIFYFIEKKLKSSILLGIGFILNPNIHSTTPYRIYQIVVNFVLTGILQLLVFRLYLHIGIEKEYEHENQLIQMNHRLLERQIEIMGESVESGKRLRHDIRHHNTVIEVKKNSDERECYVYDSTLR